MISFAEFKREMGRAYLLHTLDKCDWNITQTALALKVNRPSFYKVMRAHGVDISMRPEREGEPVAVAPFKMIPARDRLRRRPLDR